MATWRVEEDLSVSYEDFRGVQDCGKATRPEAKLEDVIAWVIQNADPGDQVISPLGHSFGRRTRARRSRARASTPRATVAPWRAHPRARRPRSPTSPSGGRLDGPRRPWRVSAPGPRGSFGRGQVWVARASLWFASSSGGRRSPCRQPLRFASTGSRSWLADPPAETSTCVTS